MRDGGSERSREGVRDGGRKERRDRGSERWREEEEEG